MPDAKKYRVLSLDGGGSWALIQVKTLMHIYGDDTRGHEVLSHFDLVAANSGGSIVAAALIEDLPLSAILALFQNEGQRRAIFAELSWWKKPAFGLGGLFGLPSPHFSTQKKQLALFAALPRSGKILMSQLNIKGKNTEAVKFLFTAYDFDRDRAKFFRSWTSAAGSMPSTASNIALADAVHASTNAPIEYFDEPAKVAGGQYWDGGLTGYNNPVLAATDEAIAAGWPKDDIAILSIGTGSTMLPLLNTKKPAESAVLFKEKQVSSLPHDLKKVATTILSDPPDAHSFIAHMMLGGALPATANQCPVPSNIVRLNPLIQPSGNATTGWKLPSGLGSEAFDCLVKLDMAAVKPEDVDLISTFCDLWMANKIHNQPIRSNQNLECEIGYENFTRAIAAW